MAGYAAMVRARKRRDARAKREREAARVQAEADRERAAEAAKVRVDAADLAELEARIFANVDPISIARDAMLARGA